MGKSKQLATMLSDAPAALDTLDELAAALGDDANFATTVTNSIATKAPLADPQFTGNVGIGANTPVDSSGFGKALDVNGTNGAALYLRDNTDSKMGVFGQWDGELSIHSKQADGTIGFYINNGSKLKIDSSGNVGIGMTPVALTDNHFVSSLSIGSNGPYILLKDENNANKMRYIANNTGEFQIGQVDDDGSTNKTEHLRIVSDGKVGIGESSPSNILHIKTSASGGPQIELDSTSGTANSAFINFDGTSLQLSTQRDMIDGSKRDTAKSWGGINIVGAAAGSYIQLQTSEGNNNAVSTKMEISKEGYVTKPSTPMFSYLGTRDHAITTTGTQTMSSSNVWASNVNHSFNNGSHFNASTGRFTAPIAGKYYFKFQCMASSFGSGYLWFYMGINGSNKSYMQMNQQTNRVPMVHHMYCDLSANDYVTCQWTNNYVSGQIHYPGFSGHLIG